MSGKGKKSTKTKKLSNGRKKNITRKIGEKFQMFYNDINDWGAIEGWVESFADFRGLKIGDVETLKPVKSLKDDFCELAGSRIYEAGNYGGGGSDDCLIHSLLSCMSPTFRKLQSNFKRNVVAHFFRRGVLIRWVQKGLFVVQRAGRNQNTDAIIDELKGMDFLGDYIAESLCNKLKINVLFMQSNTKVSGKQLPPSVSFIESFTDKRKTIQSEYTIAIHGDNSHFQPVKLFLKQKNVPVQNDYVVIGFDGVGYGPRCFFKNVKPVKTEKEMLAEAMAASLANAGVIPSAAAAAAVTAPAADNKNLANAIALSLAPPNAGAGKEYNSTNTLVASFKKKKLNKPEANAGKEHKNNEVIESILNTIRTKNKEKKQAKTKLEKAELDKEIKELEKLLKEYLDQTGAINSPFNE